jgi:hypothetical protein
MQERIETIADDTLDTHVFRFGPFRQKDAPERLLFFRPTVSEPH